MLARRLSAAVAPLAPSAPAQPASVTPGPVAAGSDPAADESPVEELPREVSTAATWPDDAAEAAFLAEARERGEVSTPVKAREEIAEETDARPLPDLDVLVARIPPEVRESLEDLFRARFVRVARVPRKALRH